MKHRCKLRVRFHECDMYGHVNHAIYLNYLEYARIHFLQSKGISITELAELGFRLYITELAIKYKKSARFNDEIIILTTINKIKKISGSFHQQILCDQKIIAEAELKWACIDDTGKPIQLPDPMKKLVNRE